MIISPAKVFTLIELLVVIAIIAILASILMPALAQAREKTRRVACAAQLKHLGLSLKAYTDDNDEFFPDGDNIEGLNKLVMQGNLRTLKMLVCPSTKTPPAEGAVPTDANLDFVYKGGFSEKDCHADTGFMIDRIATPNHVRYGNVLYGDGHVKGFRSAEWFALYNMHNSGGWPVDPH